jgi:hypothetical protein
MQGQIKYFPSAWLSLKFGRRQLNIKSCRTPSNSVEHISGLQKDIICTSYQGLFTDCSTVTEHTTNWSEYLQIGNMNDTYWFGNNDISIGQ